MASADAMEYSGHAAASAMASGVGGKPDAGPARPAVVVVAGLTTNHFGDRGRLEKMVRASHAAGADYVKVQKCDVETFYSPEQLASPYGSPFGTTFREYRRKLELTAGDAGDIEQIIDEMNQVLHLPFDQPDPRGVVGITELHQLEGGDDRRQRVTQFVAEHRQEFILGPVGALGGVAQASHLLPRDHQHAVLLVADADFPDIRLRARLTRQRGHNSGSKGQLQKFAALHHILLNDRGDGARSFDVRRMVLHCKRVECSAKIAMTALRSGLAAMRLLPDHDLSRLIFLEANLLIKK